MSARSLWVSLGLGLGVLLSAQPGAAAPQVLGLVATNGARSLLCGEETCAAYLSAFCIQRERDVPPRGTAYDLVPAAEGPILVVTRADGSVSRLPAEGRVRFESYSGYSAVRASLSRETLRELGAAAAALEVGSRVTLVPAPLPGDPSPLTEQEIALAAGPLRAAGEGLFDRPGSAASDAARLTGALISALPESGPVDREARDALWDRVAGTDRLAGMSAAGIGRAHLAYRACRWLAAEDGGPDLRGCLEERHDQIMLDINADYWDRLGGV